MNVTTAMHVILDYFLSKRGCLGLSFYDVLTALWRLAVRCHILIAYSPFKIKSHESAILRFLSSGHVWV